MAYAVDALHRARKQVGGVARAETEVHRILRDRLTVILLVTLAVDLVCAVLAYLLEHNHNGTQIHSFGTAIFWTTTQLLTVSSQMPNPLSTGGRILDVFMEVWAVIVVTSLAGAMGAFFVHSRHPGKGLETPR
jgi:hypothetical protein